MRISPRFRWVMPTATSWVTRSVAVQFIVIMPSISCGGVWVKGTGMLWLIPTLLIRMAMSNPLTKVFN